MSKFKRTVVIGASPKPYRYSYKAVKALVQAGHSVTAIGLSEGSISGVEITTSHLPVEDVDTVTIYLSPENQSTVYDYVIKVLSPRRIIFNPGTENKDFIQKAMHAGIDAIENCTLVTLASGRY